MNKALRACLMVLTISGLIISAFPISQVVGSSSATAVVSSHGSILATSVTYFEASFASPGTGSYSLNSAWPTTEPAGYQNE
jgi:hypothetical protein